LKKSRFRSLFFLSPTCLATTNKQVFSRKHYKFKRFAFIFYHYSTASNSNTSDSLNNHWDNVYQISSRLCRSIRWVWTLWLSNTIVFSWHLVLQHTSFGLNCYVCTAGTYGCGTSFHSNGAGVTQVEQTAADSGCAVRSFWIVFW